MEAHMLETTDGLWNFTSLFVEIYELVVVTCHECGIQSYLLTY